MARAVAAAARQLPNTSLQMAIVRRRQLKHIYIFNALSNIDSRSSSTSTITGPTSYLHNHQRFTVPLGVSPSKIAYLLLILHLSRSSAY